MRKLWLTIRLRIGNQSRRIWANDEIDRVLMNSFLNARLSSLVVPSGFKALKSYPNPTRRQKSQTCGSPLKMIDE